MIHDHFLWRFIIFSCIWIHIHLTFVSMFISFSSWDQIHINTKNLLIAKSSKTQWSFCVSSRQTLFKDNLQQPFYFDLTIILNKIQHKSELSYYKHLIWQPLQRRISSALFFITSNPIFDILNQNQLLIY